MEMTDKNWQDLALSPTLFWDTDASKIGLDTHAKTIVERVVLHGTWKEFKAVLEYICQDELCTGMVAAQQGVSNPEVVLIVQYVQVADHAVIGDFPFSRTGR